MSKLLKTSLILLVPIQMVAQQNQAHQFKMGLSKVAPDSVQYILNAKLNDYYEEIKTYSAIYFAEQINAKFFTINIPLHLQQ